MFIIIGGLVVATQRDSISGDFSYKYYTYGLGLFAWMVIITALLAGVLVYVKLLSDYFTQLPKQSATTATVT